MLDFLIRIMGSPQAIFIRGIMTKWYILIIIPTIMTTYYVFKGLSDAGVLAMIEGLTVEKFQLASRIAKECTPKILKLKELFYCVTYIK